MRLLDRALDASIVFSFDRTGFRRHARAFAPGDLDVRLDGQVVVLTGGTSGIGLAAARELARLGAALRLLGRDPARGRAAVEALGGGDHRFDPVDVADLAAVRAWAAALPEPRVDRLIHCAGLLPPARSTTRDGLELCFAAHVVGPHLLTALLEPRLGPGARVLLVSSGGMYTQRLTLEEPAPYDGVVAYARTKRMQVVLAELLAERLRGRAVVHAMHPGWADTPAVRTALPRFWRLTRRILRTPAEGADTLVWLAAAAAPGATTGGFWFDRRPAPTHLRAGTRESELDRARFLEAVDRAAGLA